MMIEMIIVLLLTVWAIVSVLTFDFARQRSPNATSHDVFLLANLLIAWPAVAELIWFALIGQLSWIPFVAVLAAQCVTFGLAISTLPYSLPHGIVKS